LPRAGRAAVRDALARMRFAPAEAAGHRVRVRVRMPFVFRIGP
jgi:outer membrane biosynthesis protein TonB